MPLLDHGIPLHFTFPVYNTHPTRSACITSYRCDSPDGQFPDGSSFHPAPPGLTGMELPLLMLYWFHSTPYPCVVWTSLVHGFDMKGSTQVY